jgi:4-amino-4-deoxy-L-arabinose transferase-like glycosyltransferase
VAAFLTRHYPRLALAVLALAAFNLFFRITEETVAQWDESLYAVSAWEMGQTGEIVATTFDGRFDYYNTKPPLNVWLIALAFQTLGVNLFALRLASASFAWLTVLILQRWTRRTFGAPISLVSSLVLATAFGFLHVHSGRSGTPDAPFTLVLLLTAITLLASHEHQERRVWLGPLAAAAFMLKGPGVLMPVTFVLLVEAWTRHDRPRRWGPVALGVLLFVIPVAAYGAARWRIDQWNFLGRMFTHDLVALSLTPLEGHQGGPFYFLNMLQRYQYDWLVAMLLAALVTREAWRPWASGVLRSLRERNALAVVVAAWALVTLLIPTAMQTKLPWYLNPFYPVFAIGAGAVLVRALDAAGSGGRKWRLEFVCAVIALAVVVAESKSLWQSYLVRNLAASPQGLLLSRGSEHRGTRVFRDCRHHDEAFVVKALIGAEYYVVNDVDDFLFDARPGDLYLSSVDVSDPNLSLLGRALGHSLYQLN